jgi:hypothetical protein
VTKAIELSSKVEALVEAVRKEFNSVDDKLVLHDILMSPAQHLLNRFNGQFANWSIDDMHAVIVAAIEHLGPDDSINLRGKESPVWLAATQAINGRLPSEDPTDRCWIRLDTITKVSAKPAIATGDDPRDWLFRLAVEVNGQQYDASPILFRGPVVNRVVDKILDAVAKSISR